MTPSEHVTATWATLAFWALAGLVTSWIVWSVLIYAPPPPETPECAEMRAWRERLSGYARDARTEQEHEIAVILWRSLGPGINEQISRHCR